jgi:hypothetical protein
MIAEIGKMLMIVGASILLLGGLLWLSAGFLLKFPLGRLPGDFLVQNDRFTFYFPLTTGILLSISFSLLLWLVRSIIDR